MLMGVVYVALVLSVYITNTCALRNVVRASQQSSQSTLSDNIPSDAAPVVSAVLVECPKDLQKPDEADDGPRCEEQLMINIRVNPSFQVEKSEKFLILDEVYDPRKRTKAKILSPYLIEISRGEPVMMYPLQFTKSVKSDQVDSSTSKSTETTSKSDKTNCRLASPSYQNPEGGHSQSSFNKGNAKISSTLSKAESNSNKGVELDPRKVIAVNNKLYRNIASIRNPPTDMRMTYDLYDSGDEKEREGFKHKILPVMKDTIVQKADMGFDSQPRMECSDEDNGDEELPQQQESSDDIQCQHPSLANVGVSNKISSKLEDSNLAQLGLVKSARINKETSADKITNCDDNMKKQNIENPALNSNQEEENIKKSQIGYENDRIDYSMIPLEEAGFLQDVAETGDEMIEYNDEINPISFELRSSGGRKSFNKGRAFKGGRRGHKRGRQGKHRKKGPRKIDVFGNDSGLDADEEKSEYDGKFDNAARSNEKSETHPNYRNSEVEPDSSDSYEETETGESLHNYKKIHDRSREEAFDYPEENLDEIYGEIGKKQHVPVMENFDYAEEDQPQAEPVPLVEIKKGNEGHQKYGRAKLRNEDGHYTDGNRNRKNDRDNAGYLPAKRINLEPTKDNGNSGNWGYHNSFGPQKKFYEQLPAAATSTEYYPKTFEYNVGKISEETKNTGKEFGNDFSKNDNNSNGSDDVSDEDNTYFGRPTAGHNNYLLHANKDETSGNSENSGEFTPLLSQVLVDWSDRELDVDSNMMHKQRNKYQKNYFEKSPATLQSPRSQAKLLLNNEPSMYLPRKPPFSKVIDDPNLNLGDKLGIMDIIEPRSEKSETRHREFSRELLNSYLLQPSPSLVPLTTTSTENSKAKRSFVLYDDLEMRDNLLDDDYNFGDMYPHKPLPSAPRNTEDDPAPCATCGGKGKKPHSKVPSFNPQENSCRCRNQRTACNCEGSKIVRSVSDAWYSVFNMSAPLPFLTTEVRVFRKRRKAWWQIAPSITLNSLSGIFANANLSILFSSHVDIFQLEKSLQLQNHQLLIPKDHRTVRQNQNRHQSGIKYFESKQTTADTDIQNLNGLNLNPNNILAIEGSKFGCNLMPVQAGIRSSRGGGGPDGSGSVEGEYLRSSRSAARSKKIKKPTDTDANSMEGIRTIGELGYFPTSMNLLERCPNDKNRLCLNMLEDRVPAYTIKVKLPFRENSLIQRNVFRVKIDRIITDATTKDVLQVSVDIINEGFVAHDFSVGVYNCPLAGDGGKNSKQQLLSPHIAETTTFLLPLVQESYKKHKKFYCDVIVKDMSEAKSSGAALNFAAAAVRGKRRAKKLGKEKVVSVRTLTVEVEHRCFCIWECNCHCVPKLESYVDFKACQKLTKSEAIRAGMLSCEVGDKSCHNTGADHAKASNVSQYKSRGGYNWFLYNALILLLILLLLGLIKAIVGAFVMKSVDSWGYGYVQPGSSYDVASKCRRFCVNTFFFIIFPFLFWCKCFTPSEDDLLVASTEWQLSLIQDSRGGSEEDDNDKCGYTMTKSDEEEDVILTQAFDVTSKNSDSYNRIGGGDDFLNLDARFSDWTLAFNEGIFDHDDDADDEANTKFVLQALVESRESLKKLLRTHSSQKLDVEGDPAAKLAEELVSSLKSARIVYRVFDRPVGNVRNIPLGKRYCIQGYFLPSLGAEYEFVNYNPLAQHHCISATGVSTEVLHPPVILCPQEFSRVYKNKLDVLEAGDLSVHPPSNTPCINITTMAFVASSVAKLVSEDSYHSHSQCCQAAADSPHYSSVSCARQQLSSEVEEGRTHFDQHTLSQLAMRISSMNDEMMNESTRPLEDESMELMDD